jgi:hypothetical protein
MFGVPDVIPKRYRLGKSRPISRVAQIFEGGTEGFAEPRLGLILRQVMIEGTFYPIVEAAKGCS